MGNICNSEFNKILCVLLFLIVLSIPISFFYAYGVTDTFQFKQIAVIQSLIETTHIPEFNPLTGELFNAPGYIFEVLIICHITGLTPAVLQFIPLEGFILPFACYIAAKRLVQNSGLGLIISIVIIYGVPSTTFYGIWSHGWAYILYMVFIFLLYVYANSTKKTELFGLLLIVCVAIHYFSYQVEMWCVILTLSMVLVAILLKKYNNAEINLPEFLPIILLIVMLAFSSIIYSNYLRVVQLDSQIFDTGIDFVLNKYLSQNLDFSEQFSQYLYVVGNPLITQIKIVYLATLVLPVGLILLYMMKQILFKHDIKNNIFYYAFMPSIVIVDLFFVVAYLAYGTLIFVHILFIYPIVCIMCFILLTKRMSLVYAFSIFLTILVFSHTGVSIMYNEVITSPMHYSEFDSGAEWLKEYTDSNSVVLTDIRTRHKYLLEYSYDKQKIFAKNFDLKSYEGILGLVDLTEITFDYASINMRDARIEGNNWQQFKAFFLYSDHIRDSSSTNKIYDDNTIWHLKKI